MLHTRRAGLVNKFSAAAFLLLPRDGIAGRLFSPPPPRMLLPTSPQNFVLLLSAQWVCQVNFPSFLPGCDTTTTTDTRTSLSLAQRERPQQLRRGYNTLREVRWECTRGESSLSTGRRRRRRRGQLFLLSLLFRPTQTLLPPLFQWPLPPFFFFFCRGKKAPSNCKSFSVESEADPTHAPPSHSAKLLLLL